MVISYFDDSKITKTKLQIGVKNLSTYTSKIEEAFKSNLTDIPEYSLYHAREFSLHEDLSLVKTKFKKTKLLILVGIGGSSLGIEAVHSVLDRGLVKLLVLDSVSAYNLDQALSEALKYKNVSDLAVCVVSKSGSTTETLANAEVLLSGLETKFGKKILEQTIFIGDPDSALIARGKKLGTSNFTMPKVIGGRFSVATAVGLIPLTILKHDVDDFITGYLDASLPSYIGIAEESASRLHQYHSLQYHHYNFFAFESRLEALGAWYRQLMSESIGKSTTRKGKPMKHSFVPTISTPTELHSIGQLYMSGVTPIYTDFVTFDDDEIDFKINPKNKIATHLKGLTMQEVATALYGGVIGAYQESKLPFRATVFADSLPYSLGLFMGQRIREVLYLAHLLDVNAFDQPNVELYKQKTKEILGL